MTENKIIITKEVASRVDKVIEELTEYRAIGTVEEFKALKEKSEPKKPDIEKFWGYDDLMCPGCKSYFVGEPKYCCKCGQAIDWQ